MTLLVASDLDRTLVYSTKAMRLGDPVLDAVCVEIHDGKQSGFISPRALKGLVELARETAVVPVTTRTARQYRRIVFPGIAHTWAVATNGAHILVDGEPCPDWSAEVDVRLAAVASHDEALAALLPVLRRPWVRKLRDAESRFLYAVFEPEDAPPAWFVEVDEAATGLGWVVSVQGRKVYCIPAPLTKEAALAAVAARAGAATVAAAGDSLLDRGILEYADHAVRPAHGELHEQGWTCPGLVVTTRPGGGAAEEIVEFFAGLL